MSAAANGALDTILKKASQGDGRIPGVVAIPTDRHANCYEGAASMRR